MGPGLQGCTTTTEAVHCRGDNRWRTSIKSDMRWAIFAMGLAAVPGRKAETIIDGVSGQSMMVSANEQSGTNLPPVGSVSSKMMPAEYFAVLPFDV